MDRSEEELRRSYDTILLGEHLEQLVGSDIGQWFLHRAELDIEDAKEKLITVDPEDSKAIRGIQEDIKIVEKALSYIERAITLDPNYSIGYLVGCSIMFGLGKFEEAIEWAKKGMRLGGRFYSPFFFRGSVIPTAC